MTLPKRVDLFQSKLDKEFNFKMMGVINITPNSFSDGGNFTDANSIKAQINHFRSYHCSHFDFGAESTAPFNDGISAKEEILRLSPLFDLLRAGEFTPLETLSFDTYKLEVFEEIIKLVRDELKLTNKVIFNDVSGVLEEGLFKLMNNYEFDYVYSHCLTPSRSEASNHMNYLLDEIDLSEYFRKAKDVFRAEGYLDRVIFDPCFGFSKNSKQNLDLIETTKEWITEGDRWVLGVSRKSFLRALSHSSKREDQFLFSELLHTQILSSWMNNLHNSLILIRLHDPQIFHSAVLMK